MRLEQKRVLVTGAASGIGRATAHALAHAGARVFVADLDEAGGEQTCHAVRDAGGEADFVPLDVMDDESIAALADAVLGRGAAPNVVVNVAG